jgi:hypothetical protein
MQSSLTPNLIQFLQQELAIPTEAIAIAQRHPESSSHLLPMVLWQYGLITTAQLEQIFDWAESA